jgi:ketosteroid isomerase-like protein
VSDRLRSSPSGERPADRGFATDLVHEAERAVNAYDLDAVVSLYAPSARMEVVGPERQSTHQGREDIVRAWTSMLDEARTVGLRVEKELLVHVGGVVTAAWTGSTDIGLATRGVEIFWTDGIVVQSHVLVHTVYRAESATSPAPED